MVAIKKEIILSGIGVSRGIAIGDAYLVGVDHPKVHVEDIPASGIAAEKSRFDAAVAKAEEEIRKLKIKSAGLPDTAAEEAEVLLHAHLSMLSGSRLVRGVVSRIEKDMVNAEAALEREVGELVAQFRGLKDRYIAAKADDIDAVGDRVLRILMDLPYISLDTVPQGGIVLAAA